jgi:hypothetical protein
MATTFHVTNFKNKTLDMLTGVNVSPTPFGFVNFFNGAQPADPSVTPGGAAEFAAAGSGPGLAGKMSAAGGGISQLATNSSPTTPANAAGVSSLTFARIFTTGSVALIDTPATLSGGGGGAIIDSLTSVAGVGSTLQAFGFQMPLNLGTILLSIALANRLVDIWTGANATTPNLGNVTGGSSAINLYTGAAPASADLPASGTLVATFNLTSTNLWAAASGGGVALNGAGPTVTANGTGTAAYYRLVKNNGSAIFTMQGSVGTTSSSDLVVNTVALTSGVTSVQITDGTMTL